MKRVTLLFKDERDLKRFAMIVSCQWMEMNLPALTLICDCDEAEIELAKNAFRAEVVTDQTTTS
ncbi:MAG: hypothetical protein ACTHOF_09825 [Flavisolibacter sp.]|jgi:hypothetical protein